MEKTTILSPANPAPTEPAFSSLAPAEKRMYRYTAALAGQDQSLVDQPLSTGSVSASSRKGKREHNLEGFLVVASSGEQVLGVINGLGNNEKGTFACRITGASIIQATQEGRDLRASLLAAATALGKVAKINPAERESPPGACVALAKITSNTVHFCHLGNCRALLLRPRGNSAPELLYASTDHVRSSSDSGQAGTLVTRALSPLVADLAKKLDSTERFAMQPGDLVILLSDGITQAVSNQKILSIVQSEFSIQSISRGNKAQPSTSAIAAEISFESGWDNEKLGNQTVVVYSHAPSAKSSNN